MTLTRKYWLVVSLIAAALVLAIVAIARAAQGPTIIQSPQMVSFEAVALREGDTLKSLHCTAKFQLMIVGPDGMTRRQAIQSVEFDLIANGGQQVVMNGEISTYQQIADDIMGVAMHNFKLVHPDPLPSHRRALRNPQTP